MSHHIIQALGPQALEMQAEVLLWFAAGHDVLWIPIVEVGDEPDAIARAQSEAEALIQRDQVRRRRALVDAQERLSRDMTPDRQLVRPLLVVLPADTPEATHG